MMPNFCMNNDNLNVTNIFSFFSARAHLSAPAPEALAGQMKKKPFLSSALDAEEMCIYAFVSHFNGSLFLLFAEKISYLCCCQFIHNLSYPYFSYTGHVQKTY